MALPVLLKQSVKKVTAVCIVVCAEKISEDCYFMLFIYIFIYIYIFNIINRKETVKGNFCYYKSNFYYGVR